MIGHHTKGSTWCFRSLVNKNHPNWAMLKHTAFHKWKLSSVNCFVCGKSKESAQSNCFFIQENPNLLDHCPKLVKVKDHFRLIIVVRITSLGAGSCFPVVLHL